MARESVGPAVNNLIKKKTNQKSQNTSIQNSNNINNDLRATANFNFDNINYKQRFSISKEIKK